MTRSDTRQPRPRWFSARRVRYATPLLLCVAASSTALVTHATAQTSSTTTTTAAATSTITSSTTTATTTSLPERLRTTLEHLESFKTLIATVRDCHIEAAARAFQRKQQQIKCDVFGTPRKQRRCERKVRRATCYNLRTANDCQITARVSVPPHLAGDISNGLFAAFSDQTQTISCTLQTPIEGLTTDPQLTSCPKRPKRVRHLPKLKCRESKGCAFDCAKLAISMVADAMQAVVECRRAGVQNLFNGEPVDEPACRKAAWLACQDISFGTEPCGDSSPCFDIKSRCEAARDFVDGALSRLFPACRDDIAECDDENPCTTDRCDESEANCVSEKKPNTTPCPDDQNPCTDDVCNNGICDHPRGHDGAACKDDGDVCTDDLCVSGQCVSRGSRAKLGMPCGESPCMFCLANAETVTCTKQCPDGCMCNPQVGCVRASGNAICE